jgi:hypothetical protein
MFVIGNILGSLALDWLRGRPYGTLPLSGKVLIEYSQNFLK